jgi:hypothetical protein
MRFVIAGYAESIDVTSTCHASARRQQVARSA